MIFELSERERTALEKNLARLERAVSRDERLNSASLNSFGEDFLKARGIRRLDPSRYGSDPYFRSLMGLRGKKKGNSRLGWEKIGARHPFLYAEERSDDNDPFKVEQPYGYFAEDFLFPAISKEGTVWMSLCPHEIETMADAASALSGRILVLGLGLGYFPYLLSIKESVTEVVVVDSDPEIIELFEEELFPRFERKEKITIVNSDAFAYLSRSRRKFDGVFADLWHNQEDGLPLYVRLRNVLDKREARCFYWIEGTILLYVRLGMAILIGEELCFGKESDLPYGFAETQSDRIINQLHFLLKGTVINSERQVADLLSDASISRLAAKLKL